MNAWQRGLMWVGGVVSAVLVIAILIAIGRASVSTSASPAPVVFAPQQAPARVNVRVRQPAPVVQAAAAASRPTTSVAGLTRLQTVHGSCLPGQTEVEGTPSNSTCTDLGNGRLRCRNICE